MANTSDIRSSDEVREASLSFSARNESSDDTRVSMPAAKRYSQVFRSMRPRSGSSPCPITTP